MSKFVDERVVEMSFDNKRFESNVKTSMNTINDLKNSLDFSGTANKINGQLNGISTNGLTTAIMNAKMGFTAFEIATIASIANITNRLVDLSIQMVKSLSTDQIASGWQKFGQTAISEATLLAQGFSQEQVTETLEKLLWYSDETSYSFTDMVDNMSKFTASGQGLEDSAKAMMGIANWAALSGQNAGVASRAMYQLSQAMAAGTVRLMDYKSIQNANMDTQEFRQTVLDTAVAMGQLIQNIDGSYTTLTGKDFNIGQFTTELDELWFTSEVLMNSLEKYSSGSEKLYEKIAQDSSINTASQAIEKYGSELGEFELKAFLAAQEARTFKDAIVAVKDAVASGWMNIFTQIFGSVAEAKVLWSDLANSLYDVFMDGMWTKIDILGIWADNGGRDDLFANTEENTGAFWNLFNAIVAIKDLIGGSWARVFGLSDLEDYDERINDIANKVKTFTENLKEWSEGLMLSGETAETLTNIFTGLFSVLKIIGKTIIAVWEGFEPLLTVLKPLLGFILGALGIVGKEITEFSETTTIFQKITNTLQIFFTTIIDFVRSLELLKGVRIFIDSFRDSMSKVISDVDGNKTKLISFRTIIDSIANVFKWLGDILNKYVVPILPKVFDILGSGLGWLVGSLVTVVHKTGELITRFREWVKNNALIQNGILKLKNVLSILGETFKKVIKTIGNFFKSFGSINMQPVDEFTDEVETKFSPLMAFVKGLGDLFQGLWNLIKAIIPAVGALFTFIGKGLTYVGNKLKEIFTTGDGELNFAKLFTVGFWAVVAVGVYRFADMLRSITQVFRDAFDSMFDFVNSKAMMQYMEAIKTMSISILLMVGALLILGSMDTKVLTKSMIALGVLIGFIVGVMILLKTLVAGSSTKSLIKDGPQTIKNTIEMSSNLAGLGVAFMGLGIAILLLATSLKMISKMDPKAMMQSLAVVGLMMVMMVSVMKLVGKSENGVDKAVKSMVKVAVSIALLARPLKIIGSIDTETGIRGLIGIAVLMTILILYSQFSKPIEKSQRPINGMMTTALALIMLIVPLKVIGSMDWISLGKSFTAIAGLFAILAIFSKVLKLRDAETLKELGWLLVKVGFALALFGGSMALLGLVPWVSIFKSLVTLTGVLAILSLMNVYLEKKLTKPRMKNMNRAILSLIPLAFALASFGIAMRILGSVPMLGIIKSLYTLMMIFGLIVGVNMFLENKLTEARMKNMSRMIRSLIPLAFGLGLFGIAMKIVGSIPWDKIAKSLLVVTFILGTIALFDKIMKANGSSPWTMIAMGGALIVLSAGLLVFGVALLALGSIPIRTIIVGLSTIVGVFALLAIATILLKPVILTLLSLSGTFVLFAVGVFLLVTALTGLVGIMTISAAAFAAGLIAMSAAVVTAAPKIMEALWAIVSGILQMVIDAIPMLMEVLQTLVESILTTIDTLIPLLLSTVVNLLTGILESINTIIPNILETLVNLLTSLLGAVEEIFPTVISTFTSLIFNLLDALIENMPEYVNKLVTLFITILSSLRERLPEVMIEMALFISDLVDGAVQALLILIPRLAQAGFDLVIGLIDAMGESMVENAPVLRESMIGFAENMIEAFLSFFGLSDIVQKIKEVGGGLLTSIGKGIKEGWTSLKTELDSTVTKIKGLFDNSWNTFKNIGKDIINGLIDGVKGLWNDVKKTFEDLANALPKWIKDILGIKSPSTIFTDIGKEMINGLIAGITGLWDNIKKEVEKLANALPGWMKKILGINSPSKVFAEIGEFIDMGLVKGIDDNSGDVYDSVSGLADEVTDGAKDSGLAGVLSNLINSLNGEFDNEFVIRPVLDLSEIQNGKNRLRGIMGDINGYNLSGSNQIASTTRDEINKDSRRFGNNNNNVNSNNLPTSEVINNTFNITGSNAKEIADEVSRVLQIQVDRRKAKWAL